MIDTYKITLSDGRVITVEADHEPTEQEVLASLQPAEPEPEVTPRTWRDTAQKTFEASMGVASGVAKGVYNTVAGPIRFAHSTVTKGPAATGKDVLDGIAGLPAAWRAGNAQSRGELIGEVIGSGLPGAEISSMIKSRGLGVGGRGALRFAKANARGLGDYAETAGVYLKNPMRFSAGAAIPTAIFTQHPEAALAAIPLMAVPPALQSIGRRLQSWGGASIPQTVEELNVAILKEAQAGRTSPRLTRMNTLRTELKRSANGIEGSTDDLTPAQQALIDTIERNTARLNERDAFRSAARSGGVRLAAPVQPAPAAAAPITGMPAGAPPIQVDPTTTALLDRAIPGRKLAIANVPASQSSRGISAVNPQLSIEDMRALGINPSLKVKGLTPDVVKKLLEARAARQAGYISDAQLDSQLKQLLNREE